MKSYYEEHVEDCAAALYDGGWRSTDKDEIKKSTTWMKNGQKQSVKSSKNTKTNNTNIKNVRLTKISLAFFFW